MSDDKPKKLTSKEKFDIEWYAWQNEPDPKKKARLLNEIVKKNTPLVNYFGQRVTRFSEVYVEPEDVMQAGLIGLFTALKKYDPTRGFAFSSMGWPWIRHEISDMLQRQTQVYRPRGAGMPYKEHRKNEAAMAQHNREATPEELQVTAAKLERWKKAVFKFVPMNELKDSDSEYQGKYELEDSFCSASLNAEEQMLEQEEEALIYEAVNSLSPEDIALLLSDEESDKKDLLLMQLKYLLGKP